MGVGAAEQQPSPKQAAAAAPAATAATARLRRQVRPLGSLGCLWETAGSAPLGSTMAGGWVGGVDNDTFSSRAQIKLRLQRRRASLGFVFSSSSPSHPLGYFVVLPPYLKGPLRRGVQHSAT